MHVWGNSMHVQLDNLCTGLLRQHHCTHVIERLASVSRFCFTTFEVLNASSIDQGHGHAGMWVFTASGCQRLWCEPRCDKQSMESLPDVWLSYPAPCWWSTTSNHAKRGPISCVTVHTSSLLQCDYSTKWVDVNISTQIVHNHLSHSGLRSRRTCIHIFLTWLHQQVHLDWAQDRINWTDNDWDPVLFTDQSRYCLDFTDRHAGGWSRGERFQDANISEHGRYGLITTLHWLV